MSDTNKNEAKNGIEAFVYMTIRNLDYYEIMFNFGKIKTL
jgi:hypothetical protein